MYPLKLQAPLKDYIWGGTALKTKYNKVTDLEKVAESWELACHKDGHSIILNGEASGMTLESYIAQQGERILGTHGSRFTYFPLLIKLIDAKDNLSVQVHPENEYALRVEGEYGKTEMWYIVDCEPGASLLYGFKKEISKEEFERRIADHTLLDVCNRVMVHKGDVFFIEAGTLHAIGKGILIAEIQQNSNTTYRIYDYDRLGNNGKPRELHVAKALDVTKRVPPVHETKAALEMDFFANYKADLLVQCEYFTVYHFDLHGKCHLQATKKSFQSILLLDGILEIEYASGEMRIEKGESVFIPAEMGEYTIKGEGNFILSMV
ncbi:MAG: type I phosphomannose isomerase catalytic subunit [Selenomonadaceae bacterium]